MIILTNNLSNTLYDRIIVDSLDVSSGVSLN